MPLHVLIALFAPVSLAEYHFIVSVVTAGATANAAVTAIEAEADATVVVVVVVVIAVAVNSWCSCPFSHMPTRACSIDTLRLTERQLYFVIRNRNGSHWARASKRKSRNNNQRGFKNKHGSNGYFVRHVAHTFAHTQQWRHNSKPSKLN